jgi:hypothetical protein
MHMSHITSDRGDDLERSNRMAEYEPESMIRLYAYYLANIEVLQRAMRLKTGSLTDALDVNSRISEHATHIK